AEIVGEYLKKGSQVLIEGRLVLDQWTAQDGSKRSKHSVSVESMQMLGSKESSNQGGYEQPRQQQETKKEANESVPEIDIDDDEIPF
ncbi:MAG: single-stranded DNA-binding protein, partial [Sulfurovaceae bacterium]